MTRFAAPIAEQIWDMKYRFKEADGTPLMALSKIRGVALPAPWPWLKRMRITGKTNFMGHLRISNSTRGSHYSGRWNRTQGDIVQLLCHGHNPRQHGWYF